MEEKYRVFTSENYILIPPIILHKQTSLKNLNKINNISLQKLYYLHVLTLTYEEINIKWNKTRVFAKGVLMYLSQSKVSQCKISAAPIHFKGTNNEKLNCWLLLMAFKFSRRI
ncbi:hypothetical protein E2320_018302 [Naja naja]|nr:hypothetical protein E2320_018302 [Naja naja]